MFNKTRPYRETQTPNAIIYTHEKPSYHHPNWLPQYASEEGPKAVLASEEGPKAVASASVSAAEDIGEPIGPPFAPASLQLLGCNNDLRRPPQLHIPYKSIPANTLS